MLTARRLAILIVTGGLIASVVLGVLPLGYRTTAGVQKGVFYEAQDVACGRAFKLVYEAPLGSTDECTPEVVGRWIVILVVLSSSLLLVGGLALMPRVRRSKTCLPS